MPCAKARSSASSATTLLTRTPWKSAPPRHAQSHQTSRTNLYEISDPTYLDPAALDTELRRVFDVCHGCRMCFNYCPSLPSLFDAIDRHEEKGEGEVAALTAKEIDEVVDLCYQCKLCYVKCPYTPPHKFAIDFPRLMFRAKLLK